MYSARYSAQMRLLCWIALGVIGLLAMSAAGCGPGLVSQVRLNDLGKRAADHCVAQDRRAKCAKDPASTACTEATAACKSDLACAAAVRDSVTETQRVQVARAAGIQTDADESLVRVREAEAVARCAAYTPDAVKGAPKGSTATNATDKKGVK